MASVKENDNDQTDHSLDNIKKRNSFEISRRNSFEMSKINSENKLKKGSIHSNIIVSVEDSQNYND